jgi:hypothetical protein
MKYELTLFVFADIILLNKNYLTETKAFHPGIEAPFFHFEE